MTDVKPLDTALAALDDCATTLADLDARCCEPGRSPRMRALAETLEAARINTERMTVDARTADVALAELEEAGAQVGRLQVGCCAPDRLPLYADLLEGLTKAQLGINAELGRGH